MLGKLIRDKLNVRKIDFFCSYGLDSLSIEIVNYMKGQADVSAGIALDNVQYEEARNVRIPVYRGVEELDAACIFDRVYCDYLGLPNSQKDMEKIFRVTYDLCVEKGMVLLTGLDQWDLAKRLIAKSNLTLYWFAGKTLPFFDLLYTKEHG